MSEATTLQINYAKSLGIEKPEQYSKETLRELIEKQVEGKKAFDEDMENSESKEEVPIVRPGSPAKTAEHAPVGQKNTSFYVSYTKDVFCAAIAMEPVKSAEESRLVMENCIELVKQAVKAFE